MGEGNREGGGIELEVTRVSQDSQTKGRMERLEGMVKGMRS